MGIDPANCGSCGHACFDSEQCQNANCVCSNGGIDCGQPPDGNTCRNGIYDPTNCGHCSVSCNSQEACNAGHCSCRPPKTQVGAGCFDVRHDGAHCGSNNMMCGSNEVCGALQVTGGSCITTMLCQSLGGVVCGKGCYGQNAFQSDPFNCGNCGNVCNSNEMCVDGQCHLFTVPVTSCQNTGCDGGDTCCQYPGIPGDYVCLQNDKCPAG